MLPGWLCVRLANTGIKTQCLDVCVPEGRKQGASTWWRDDLQPATTKSVFTCGRWAISSADVGSAWSWQDANSRQKPTWSGLSRQSRAPVHGQPWRRTTPRRSDDKWCQTAESSVIPGRRLATGLCTRHNQRMLTADRIPMLYAINSRQCSRIGASPPSQSLRRIRIVRNSVKSRSAQAFRRRQVADSDLPGRTEASRPAYSGKMPIREFRVPRGIRTAMSQAGAPIDGLRKQFYLKDQVTIGTMRDGCHVGSCRSRLHRRDRKVAQGMSTCRQARGVPSLSQEGARILALD